MNVGIKKTPKWYSLFLEVMAYLKEEEKSLETF